MTNVITLALTLSGCHVTAPMFLAKCPMGALEQSFLECLVKLKTFLILVKSCKLNVKTKWENEED